MHDLFLNVDNLEQKANNWNIVLQLRADLCSLSNNSTQYK